MVEAATGSRRVGKGVPAGLGTRPARPHVRAITLAGLRRVRHGKLEGRSEVHGTPAPVDRHPAGGPWLPVDADGPHERGELVFTVADGCAVLDPALTMRGTPIAESFRPTPDADAWIIFTSGSTGRPKGVAVSHRSAAAFVDAE